MVSTDGAKHGPSTSDSYRGKGGRVVRPAKQGAQTVGGKSWDEGGTRVGSQHFARAKQLFVVRPSPGVCHSPSGFCVIAFQG